MSTVEEKDPPVPADVEGKTPRKFNGSSRVHLDGKRAKIQRWSWPAVRHDLAVGLISGTVVALLSLAGAVYFDDKRSDREAQQEERRSVQEGRQENLRFVRDRSSAEEVDRPFQDIDLNEQNLSGLGLVKADFSEASLVFTQFIGADLSGAKFVRADLSGANFESADLEGADLYKATLWGTNFIAANLRGADLRDADLRNVVLHAGATMTVCYDDKTQWPTQYTPPALSKRVCDLRWGEVTGTSP